MRAPIGRVFCGLVLAAATILTSDVDGQCAVSGRDTGSWVGYNTIQLVPNLPAGLEDDFEDGYGAWNADTCNLNQAQFPEFVVSANPVMGARVIEVNFYQGSNPNNRESCGRFAGNEIQLFELALVSGRMIPCTNPTHFTDTVSHELGHLLGLVDQGTSCGRHIMAPRQVSSSGAYTDREVQQDECDLVAETLETPTERRLRCGVPSRTPSGTATARRVVAALDDCTDDGTGGGGPGGGSEPRDPGSPIVVDLDRAGFRFTSLAEGVHFDLDADGVLDRVSWTAVDAAGAFLVLDRNDNGWIDDGSELFGDHTEQPPGAERHGFRALAVFDDDGDGWITEVDSAFPLLRLWIDASHDGQSQPSELVTLDQASVRAIGVDPVESRRLDRHGNQLRYKTLVRLTSGTTQAIDVFLVME